jgi:hypothetical protein
MIFTIRHKVSMPFKLEFVVGLGGYRAACAERRLYVGGDDFQAAGGCSSLNRRS